MRMMMVGSASLLSVISLVYHLIKRASWWFILINVPLVWCWCALMVFLFGYGLRLILGDEEGQEEISFVQQRKQLDLATFPEDDEFFR